MFRRKATIKHFVANLGSGGLTRVNGQLVDRKWNVHYNLDPYSFNSIIDSKSPIGFGVAPKDFRSGNNSGHCAIQLAIMMRFNPIYLLGIDMMINGGSTHFHSGYGKKRSEMVAALDGYYENFKVGIEELKTSLPDLRIISCSSKSRLNQLIEYIPFESTSSPTKRPKPPLTSLNRRIIDG